MKSKRIVKHNTSKMTIITDVNSFTANNAQTAYTNYKVSSSGTDIYITTASGKTNNVTILVNNAMQRAYRGIGKTFIDFQEALAHYKSEKVVSAIKAVMIERGQI